MELLERQVAALDEQIRQATEPVAPQLDLLPSIPGSQAIAARGLGVTESDRADAPRPGERPEHPVLTRGSDRGPDEPA